jgi:hypothetical protein
VVVAKKRTLTPEEFDLLITAIPDRYRLMVETAIETGMRWGELIAQKPRHVDFLRKTITVADTIMEVSRRHSSPTGERYVPKAYPKDNEPRTLAVRQDWLDAVAEHISAHSSAVTTCSSPQPRAPRSRATPSGSGSGCPWSRPPASASTCECKTCATPTPPGCWPAGPTSPLSWTDSGTPTSKPPRSTCTPRPRPTQRNLDALDRMTRRLH